ncbi:unnamed protein product [Amoebophrya sp. A120]|nr:unnamed protein product [Amoebophrya sp. A120]|eukprot:GSA120T00007646001.1
MQLTASAFTRWETKFDGLHPTTVELADEDDHKAILQVHAMVGKSLIEQRKKQERRKQQEQVRNFHDLHGIQATMRKHFQGVRNPNINPDGTKKVLDVEATWRNFLERRKENKLKNLQAKKEVLQKAQEELRQHKLKLKRERERLFRKTFIPDEWNTMTIYERHMKIQLPRKEEWHQAVKQAVREQEKEFEAQQGHLQMETHKNKSDYLPTRMTKELSDEFATSQREWLTMRDQARQEAMEARKEENIVQFPFSPQINPYPFNYLKRAVRKGDKILQKQAMNWAKWEKMNKRAKEDVFTRKDKSVQTGAGAVDQKEKDKAAQEQDTQDDQNDENKHSYAEETAPAVTYVSVQDPFLKRVLSTIDTFAHPVKD